MLLYSSYVCCRLCRSSKTGSHTGTCVSSLAVTVILHLCTGHPQPRNYRTRPTQYNLQVAVKTHKLISIRGFLPAFYSADLPTKSGVDEKRVPPFFGSYAESIYRAASPGTESSSQRTPPYRLLGDELSSSKSTTTSIGAPTRADDFLSIQELPNVPIRLVLQLPSKLPLISSRRFA